MITAFWRDDPLTQQENDLVDALFEGHRAATRRQNLSSEVLKASFMGNGNDFNKSVAAASCTLGGLHAPIEQAYEFLSGDTNVDYYIYREEKIPGWGNSFVKGKPDNIWDRVAVEIDRTRPVWSWKINYITGRLHDKLIFPNAACYTAAVAVIIGMPKKISPALVHEARLWTWAELAYDSTREASS